MNFCKKKYPGNPHQIYNEIIFYSSIIITLILLYIIARITYTNSSDTNSSDLKLYNYNVSTNYNVSNITHYLRH
jgi:hypothetical protein